MLSAFWFNWVGLLFDTAPYIVAWLLLEVLLHSRAPYYQALSHRQKLWFGLRYALGYLWDKSWYWQLIGVSVFAALALVLPDNIKEMADLMFDASYQPEWYAVLSVALLSMLTLARLLKRAFPNGGGGCDDGSCSVDGRRD
jgi:membrane protease YdiL (CAAX protease family)